MHAAFRYVGILALLAGISPADAARVVRVYEVTVREPTAAQVAPAAMRAALVRATGRRDAASDPSLAALVNDAQRYVRSSRPGEGGRTDVVFNGSAVESAILAAGRSVWPAERPLTLVVFDAAVDSATLEAARTQVEAAAGVRGLPLSIVPAATLMGSATLATREMLLPAVQRLGAEAVLVGRVEGGPSPAWHWTLTSPDLAESWSGAPGAAVDATVDALVRVGDAPVAASDNDLVVLVAGVRSLADYAGVSRALAAVGGVRRVALEETVGDTARFRVTTAGSGESLAAALAGQARLVPAASAAMPGVLSLSWLP